MVCKNSRLHTYPTHIDKETPATQYFIPNIGVTVVHLCKDIACVFTCSVDYNIINDVSYGTNCKYTIYKAFIYN